MARKVYVEIKVRAIITVDEGTEISEVIEDMDYSFNDGDSYQFEDTEIRDYEVTDSK